MPIRPHAGRFCRRASIAFSVVCAALGAITLAGCTTSGTASILSYNVHGLPGSVTGDDTETRMHGISPHLDDYDIAAVQENFYYGVALAADVQNRLAYSMTTMKPGTFAPSGLTVFTSIPAAATGGEPWEACNGYLDAASDCFASKGFQFLRLTVPFTALSFDLYDLHMDAGNDALDDDARAAQTVQLLDFIAEHSAGQAIMILGDFNMSIDDPEDVPLLNQIRSEAGVTDACSAVGCPEPDRIDQLFFRSGDQVELTATSWEQQSFVDETGTPLSDHDPIVFGMAYALTSGG